MWDLLDRKTQVTTIVIASWAVFYALQEIYHALNGGSLSPWGVGSIVVSILFVLVILAQSLIFWSMRRWPWAQAHLFPDLNGVWKGKLISDWKDPTTQQPVAAIPTTVTIRQGLLSTKVTLKTGESESVSDHEVLEVQRDIGRFRIWYSYGNTPKPGVRDRSHRHQGVAFLEMDWTADRNRLTGHYYTDRKTTGEMDLRRSKK